MPSRLSDTAYGQHRHDPIVQPAKVAQGLRARNKQLLAEAEEALKNRRAKQADAPAPKPARATKAKKSAG
jgi:hypothetical protein